MCEPDCNFQRPLSDTQRREAALVGERRDIEHTYVLFCSWVEEAQLLIKEIDSVGSRPIYTPAVSSRARAAMEV